MHIVRSSVAVIIVSAVGAVACSNADPSKSVEALGSTTQADTVAVMHSSWNGGSAQAFAGNYPSSMSFNAWENSTAKSRTAYLQFSLNGPDPASQVCTTYQYCDTWDPSTWQCAHYTDYSYCSYTRYVSEFAYGQIPNGDFLVGQHGAKLTTNLANDPDLMVTRCVTDYSQWIFDACAPVTTGTFDVTWTDDGNYSSDSQGTSSTTWNTYYSTYTSRSTGHYSQSSATVSGTALGLAVNASGNIMQSKGSSVSKDVIQGPGGNKGGGGGVDAGLDAGFTKD